MDVSDDPLRWQTIDSSTDYTCPGFDVRVDEVRLPSGATSSYHTVEEVDTVVILAFTPTNDVVVIDEWRQAVGHLVQGLPAGGIEPGESITAAAHRELAEETGYAADSLNPLTEAEPANGLLDATHHAVVARGCSPTAERDLDANESIRVDTLSYDELVEAIQSGRVRDGRTAWAVLYHEVFGDMDHSHQSEDND